MLENCITETFSLTLGQDGHVGNDKVPHSLLYSGKTAAASTH
jgi:hypothetical protein